MPLALRSTSSIRPGITLTENIRKTSREWWLILLGSAKTLDGEEGGDSHLFGKQETVIPSRTANAQKHEVTKARKMVPEAGLCKTITALCQLFHKVLPSSHLADS